MSRGRRRAYGQHFLADPRVVARILDASGAAPGEHILEIGPGQGVLTVPLLEQGARVTAVEKDRELARALEMRLAGLPGFRLVVADATKADLAALGPFDRIVSNLPYSVSTPLTFRFLDLTFREAVLMYQREFADRLLAKPGGGEYGRLTASVAYHARVERVLNVPAGAFRPAPRVGSTVVRLVPHPRPPFEIPNVALYRDVLRILFSGRRKTLRASLLRHRSELGVRSIEAMEGALSGLGWAGRRPEELSPAELGRLALEIGRVVPAPG